MMEKENKVVPMPQAEAQEQTPKPQPSELEIRARNEIAMLKQTEMKKKLQAQMKPKIGAEEVRKASEILRKYKEGKARLEQKIIANEEFWKLRQWNYMNDGKADFKPATAWLWSCIQSRYSDAMDSYPTCNFQPRQGDDKTEAEKLSAIVPIILEHNRYEDVYSDIVWYTLKHGGCVQGVFWDGSKHNGIGDISVKKIDFINLFWESGITDIQDSQNVFNTELVANSILEQRYPQCIGKLGAKTITLAKYLYDDNVDCSDKSVVVDWYYHTYVDGKKTLQYVKYVNDIVLYATENEIVAPEKVTIDPETGIPLTIPLGEAIAKRGLYDHGLYPFVPMALYPIEGSICGYGLTDIGRDTQIQIDQLNKAITDNALEGATPRFFIRDDGTINVKEYENASKKLVRVEGNIGEENIRPIDSKRLDSIYVEFLNQKIDELKYVTSNQDVNNGVAPSGITAASAIAALQESQGKNARSSNKTFHRAYRDVCYLIVELIRQFYDVPRTFRINPDGMREQFVQYDNQGLKPQPQATMGMDMGLRVPEFDIDVTSEKANPYKKMEINEMALSFYNAGFFNPQMSDQALACLNMMDFTKKEDVMQKIEENGTLTELLLLYQKMALQFANQIDPALGKQVAEQILSQGGQPIPMASEEGAEMPELEHEHPFVEKARNDARESTEVE
jgi:biopolymer transport protein ExbD